MSTNCKLIAPGVAINGLMSITKSDMYFEMDEDDAENKAIDPQVGPGVGVVTMVTTHVLTMSLDMLFTAPLYSRFLN